MTGTKAKASIDGLIAEILRRRDPDTVQALFKLAGTHEPGFVADWKQTSALCIKRTSLRAGRQSLAQGGEP